MNCDKKRHILLTDLLFYYKYLGIIKIELLHKNLLRQTFQILLFIINYYQLIFTLQWLKKNFLIIFFLHYINQ